MFKLGDKVITPVGRGVVARFHPGYPSMVGVDHGEIGMIGIHTHNLSMGMREVAPLPTNTGYWWEDYNVKLDKAETLRAYVNS